MMQNRQPAARRRRRPASSPCEDRWQGEPEETDLGNLPQNPEAGYPRQADGPSDAVALDDETAVGEPEAQTRQSDSLSDVNWSDAPRKGYFSGRPGPGRGKFAGYRQAASASSEGDRGQPIDLLGLFHKALQEFGPEKFALTLMRKSPVTFAQFFASMNKLEGFAPADRVVNIIFPEGSVPLPSMVQQGQELLASDAGEQGPLATLRAENASLKVELARLRGEGPATSEASDAGLSAGQSELFERHAQDIADAIGTETWTCPDCQRLVGQTRTYPLTKHCCDFCGHASPSLTELESTASGRSGIASAVRLDETSGPGWRDLGSHATLDDAIASVRGVKR